MKYLTKTQQNNLFAFGNVFEHVLDRPQWNVAISIVTPIAGQSTHVRIFHIGRARISATQWLAAVGQRARLILEIDVQIRQLKYS